MKRNPALTAIIPAICGRVTYRSTWSPDAPSTLASTISRETACSTESSRSPINGVHSHTLATTRPINAVPGVESHEMLGPCRNWMR